jgi:1,4-dihydroxy-2-naphthoate octaprenyltransferase
MPNDVKAILSVVTMMVGLAYAYWERSSGNPELFWFVIIFATFAVVAMWVFPEATAGKPRNTYDEPKQ